MERRVRAERRLRVKDVPTLGPGTHEDGGGLRLVVEPSGARRWALRYTLAGKRHSQGLGPWPLVQLDAARDKALDIRRAAREGRTVAVARSVTFEQAFEDYFEKKREGLSKGDHVAQWAASVRTHAIPVIGHMPVADVRHADVVKALRGIWHTTPAQAKRVLQRLEEVFRYAIANELRTAASPCVGVAKELGGRRRSVKHHEALAYREVPGFIRMLRTCNSSPVARLAFEFAILTAVRSKEAMGAVWPEIDEDRALWSIPAKRMTKTYVAHAVPLSARCLAILREARALSPGSQLVFPRDGKQLGAHTFQRLLGRCGVSATPHGFRSSFRDWAAETGVAREVAEAALAHVVRGVEGAYMRTRFLEERRRIMEAWSDLCESR
jgi:integrase